MDLLLAFVDLCDIRYLGEACDALDVSDPLLDALDAYNLACAHPRIADAIDARCLLEVQKKPKPSALPEDIDSILEEIDVVITPRVVDILRRSRACFERTYAKFRTLSDRRPLNAKALRLFEERENESLPPCARLEIQCDSVMMLFQIDEWTRVVMCRWLSGFVGAWRRTTMFEYVSTLWRASELHRDCDPFVPVVLGDFMFGDEYDEPEILELRQRGYECPWNPKGGARESNTEPPASEADIMPLDQRRG